MGLMDQLGQAAGGMLGGQGGQNSLLQAVAGLLGKDSSIGGLAGLVIYEQVFEHLPEPKKELERVRQFMREDALLTGLQPAQGMALTVRLRNGLTLEDRQDDFRSMSPDEVDARFLLHAEPCLGHERATRALTALRSIEHVPDVRQLTDLLGAGR